MIKGKWILWLLPVLLLISVLADLLYTRGSGFSFEITDWFTSFRIPRVLAALLAGSALSAAGLILQTLFRNPLAGPFVTGITPGASFSIGLLLLVFPAGTLMGALGYLSMSVTGMLGGIAVLLIQLFISRKTTGIFTLLLTGVMLGYLLGAGVEIMQTFAQAEQIRSFVLWGLGSFDRVYTEQIFWFAPLVMVGLLAVWFMRFQLDAWLPGEMYARNSGVNVKKLKLRVIIVSGVLAGLTTALCGPVGFVGMAAPHLARLTARSSQHGRLLLPSILWGSVLCVVADFLAHSLLPYQTLNVNAICAIMGAPVVLWVLLRRQRHRAS